MDSSATPTSSSRKRPRENETESQRVKREKAAERQRRKRERDRNSSASMAVMGFASPNNHQHMQQQQHQSISAPVQPPPQPTQQPDYSNLDLTPEEVARRDRVRAAARERQRKHRMLVKQRKMRELGLDMGNEIMPGMEEVHYRVGADGQYQQVMPHELQPPPMGGPHEPPFPQGQPLGGQTFASTLLLSFSCAPLLKQHLLRTLHMTNEELTSLEPVLAEAWERWDHARRAHYAEQAAKAGLAPPPPIFPVEMTHEQQHHTNAFSIPTNGPADSTHPSNEFRARFHRPLVAPTPFRTFAAEGQAAVGTASTPTSASGSSGDAIDPHLTASGSGTNTQANGTGAITGGGVGKSEGGS